MKCFPGNTTYNSTIPFKKVISSAIRQKYLYVHFLADWSEDDDVLPACGDFNYEKLKPMIADLDRLSHSNSPIIEQTAKFFELLLHLYHKETKKTTADQICVLLPRNTPTIFLWKCCATDFISAKIILLTFLKMNII